MADGGGMRDHLRSALARTAAKTSSALAKGSELASQHEYGRVARGLNRAQALAQSAHASTALNSDGASSSSRSIQTDAGGGRTVRRQGSMSSISTVSTVSSISSTSAWRAYFSASRREIRNAASHTEGVREILKGKDRKANDKYAVLRKTGPKIIVEVEIAGWAFRTRPVNQATRTQRIFVAMAKSLAGLAKLPAAAAIKAHDGELASLPDEPQELAEAGTSAATDPKNATFARLLALGNLPPTASDQDIEDALQGLHLSEEPESMFDDPPPVHMFGAGPNDNAHARAASLDSNDASHTPTLPSKLRMSSLTSESDGLATPRAESRSDFVPPPRPARSVTSASPASSRSTSPTRRALPDDSDLHHMHTNLTQRLRAFFAQKLDGRRIRVSVYKIDSEDQEISEAQCVAKGTVVTGAGGVFKQIISFPAGDQHKEGQLLRILTELLPADEDASPSNADGRLDSTITVITRSDVPRVISDIDDTCKHTQVVHGIRAVFRNVFTLPFDRVEVEGVAPWYRAMHDLGTPIHYVSNGPVELSEVIRDFMHSAGLPIGQLKLKEYSGGSQMISNVWEPAGQRKRANLVDVLQHFPESKFILIGDSGEQDLEIYATLAAEFRQQILAIFIRDVTTPKGMATAGLRKRPSLKRLVSDKLRPSASRRNSQVENELPRIPPPKQFSEPNADFLSPNNPIDVTDSSTPKLVATFYRRIAAAEQLIPEGISLRIFRSGHECEQEALKMLRAVNGQE